MLRDNDADIDALVGSVVGHNGQPAEFPAPPENVVPIRGGLKRGRAAKRPEDVIAELSGELAEHLAASEAERVIVDPAKVPLRFSRLRHMSASALHYWQSVQDNKDDTIAMRFGRGVHALVLGTPVVRWSGKTRHGKAWELFKALHADKEILSTKEWERAHGIYEAIKRHPIANDLIFGEGAVREETIEFELMGRKCTARPDVRFGTDVLVDLKTTRCAEPRKFERDAMFRGYHSQFSFYGRAMAEAFGAFPKRSLCVAVEPVKPFAITVLELTPGAIAEGEKAWRLWFEEAMVCEAAGVYPAYTQTIESLDVADTGDVKLVIDGEEFSYDED
jgi:hypothetical protein